MTSTKAPCLPSPFCTARTAPAQGSTPRPEPCAINHARHVFLNGKVSCVMPFSLTAQGSCVIAPGCGRALMLCARAARSRLAWATARGIKRWIGRTRAPCCESTRIGAAWAGVQARPLPFPAAPATALFCRPSGSMALWVLQSGPLCPRAVAAAGQQRTARAPSNDNCRPSAQRPCLHLFSSSAATLNNSHNALLSVAFCSQARRRTPPLAPAPPRGGI